VVEQTWLMTCSASSLARSVSCCCSVVWAKDSRNFTTSDKSWSRSFVTSSLNLSKSRILNKKNTEVRQKWSSAQGSLSLFSCESLQVPSAQYPGLKQKVLCPLTQEMYWDVYRKEIPV
jgi:hypothetical protein